MQLAKSSNMMNSAGINYLVSLTMNCQETNETGGPYQLKEIKDPANKCNMWILFGSISKPTQW